MLCQKCKQNNATSHIHYVRNGIVRDMYLCDSCTIEYKTAFSNDGDIFKMLSSFLNDNTVKFKETLKCDCCGTDFNTIRKTGKVGCGNCYSVFEKELSPTISRIHGKTTHIGKKPCVAVETSAVENESIAEKTVNEKESKIAELKAQMSVAVKNEDFESAARLRDEIKSLEEK